MRIIFVFLFSFIFYQAQSQVKVLFDATKAEMAGNADWVIDADLHNLYGNESNPQRIPTTAQSGINANTPESYWTGALSAWAVDAVKEGYVVETLPVNGAITYGNNNNSQDLSNYTVFVVCEPNILFTASEKTALINYVQDGGGLFIISDHDNSDRNNDGYDSVDIWNDLLTNNSVTYNPFGFIFDYEFYTEATTNIPNLPGDPLLHGSYGDVTSVEFFGGTSMTLFPIHNPSVQGVVYRPGFNHSGNKGVMCAYATYGMGKVVALGDSSPPDDGSGDNNDNLYNGWTEDANGNHERLIMNATRWLAASGPLAVNVPEEVESVDLYPNPVTGFLHIDSHFLVLNKLMIYNSIGQLVYTQNDAAPIDMSPFNKGLYFLEIQMGSTTLSRLVEVY